MMFRRHRIVALRVAALAAGLAFWQAGLFWIAAGETPQRSKASERSARPKAAAAAPLSAEVFSTGLAGPAAEIVGFINEQLRQGWRENEIVASPPADDAEWVRRVHLDIVGHVPDAEVVHSFLADEDPAKRSKLIDRLLEGDPGYVRNFTTIWTNLLIGRATPRDIDRPALQKFLREAFGRNRGWHETVVDLLTAQGNNKENGAANFLLAHLNDEAVPATAISARLFLGVQVQCTQCHNHPFNPDLKQNAFWEFNNFFKQARSEVVRKYNEKTGRMDVEYVELVDEDFEGGVFFERRNGLLEVAYPRYNGTDVSPTASNRRLELARLITQGERPQLADAMVNRMWGHFFGYGFVNPVDDMASQTLPSHPALLERLSIEFVKSKYDLRQLIRWICNSEAYNLTSRFNGKANEKDNPAAGEMPLFSHLYLKSMTAEQLFDSLIVATGAHKAGGTWEQAEARRQEWMQQFVQTFGTDENDEATTFDGTITQALMMMNGELMDSALSAPKGSVLHDVLSGKGSNAEKVKLLYLATLSREPGPKEIQAFNRMMKKSKSPAEAYQDLYWALLNSNEFIINH